jgi:hypothetical protein
MTLFGLGYRFGMAALSGVIGWPLSQVGRHRGMARALSFAVGAVSIAIGLGWGYPLVARIF